MNYKTNKLEQVVFEPNYDHPEYKEGRTQSVHRVVESGEEVRFQIVGRPDLSNKEIEKGWDTYEETIQGKALQARERQRLEDRADLYMIQEDGHSYVIVLGTRA